MTEDQKTILMFKGMIASLPADQQGKVEQAAQEIKSIIADYPDGEAVVALGLVATQIQAE
jgi:hypothetical protein